MPARCRQPAVRITIASLPSSPCVNTMKSFTRLFCLCLMIASSPVRAAIDRDAAATVAQKASGGRVLTVDRTERDGRSFWRVKVLTAQGEVRLLLVDAASGHLQ